MINESLVKIISNPVSVVKASAVPALSTTINNDDILASFILPVGSLGLNSILEIKPCFEYSSSSNDKILKVIVGGVTVWERKRTLSLRDTPVITLFNKNSLTAQLAPNYSEDDYVSISSTPSKSFSINFNSPVIIQLTGKRTSATDSISLSSYVITHFAND